MKKLQVIFLVACFIILGSCTEKLQDAPLGDEVAVSSKDDIMKDALTSANPVHLQKDDWVLTEQSQTLFGSNTLISGYVDYKIISRSEDTAKSLINLTILMRKTTIKNDGTKEEKTSEYDWNIPKNYKPPQESDPDEAEPCSPYSKNFKKIRVFGLSRSTKDIEPPPLVKNAPDCGGIKNCRLRIQDISWNETWDLPEETMRFHCAFEVANQIPYFGMISKRCISFIAKSNGQQVPVEICDRVVNLHRGIAE